ncbi:MAG: cytochrome c3 family protein [Desulfobacterales bacterium]|nr:cytochrome c3 family protein [Desulfobacterales bacterium]
MNKKSLLLVLSIIGIAVLFFSAGLYAGTTAADVIKMENKIYSQHKKGIVEFTHKKHAEEYGAKCGDCHHDAAGKPLELKAGDDVQGCAECHSTAGQKPKGKDAPKLSKKEAIAQYHAEALHANCIDCHKDYNKKTGNKTAPQTCAKCHPKK